VDRRSIVPALVLVCLSFGPATVDAELSVVPDAPPYDAARAIDGYGKLPLYFEPADEGNGFGRTFIARGAHYLIAVSRQGARLALRTRSRDAAATAIIDLRFVDADGAAVIDGVDPQDARIHRLRGGTDRDRVDVPTFGSVLVAGIYPGIDAVFRGNGRALEYDLIVAPTADPSSVRLRIDGASRVSLDERGDLRVETAAGPITMQRPLAYQQTARGRAHVDSRFVLAGASDVQIALGDYDTSHALTVDPTISYATWLNGNGAEQATGVTVDAAGNAYVVGWTTSTDFPLLSPYDRSIGRYDTDVFVSKVNAAGTALVWSTYLGAGSNSGASIERGLGIAVDAAGSAYVIGTTNGSDFPVSANAYQKGVAGGASFVAKLGPAGNTLVYSTYLTGATASGIAIDASGSAYVAGSATPSFATTPGALRTMPGSSLTGFVIKLNPAGSAAMYATFLGGTVLDSATSIAVDVQGNAFVGGWTKSADFPLANPFQSTIRGGREGFVAKLDASGSRLLYSTLLGGALDDTVNAIAIDPNGNAYVAGETYSKDFPVKDGFQPRKGGLLPITCSVGNAFVAKLEPAGNALVYGSFLGGEVCYSTCQLINGGAQYRADVAYAIGVDGAGHAYVAGLARSYTFPLVDSSARRMQDDTEDSAFVAKVSMSGATLLWSTFTRTGFHEGDIGIRFPLGAATGVAVDAAGNAYVAGDADSYGNFQPTAGAFQVSNSGTQGGVLVKFAAAPAMSLATSNPRVDAQTPVTLTATLAGPALAGTVQFLDNGVPIGGTVPLTGNTASAMVTLGAGVHPLTGVLRLPGVASDTPVVYQVVDVPLACPVP
jgi:hypothetical protein